jgi:hypothetical protein
VAFGYKWVALTVLSEQPGVETVSGIVCSTLPLLNCVFEIVDVQATLAASTEKPLAILGSVQEILLCDGYTNILSLLSPHLVGRVGLIPATQ